MAEDLDIEEVIGILFSIVVLLVLFPSSFICTIIHLYKFFRSNNPQSLATKNLTFYCIYLLLAYVCMLVFLLASLFFPARRHFNQDLHSLIFYLDFNVAFVKFIMALDICLCFRKISVYLQRCSGSQNKKFFVYCLLGVCLPMVYTIFWIIFSPKRIYEYGGEMIIVDNVTYYSPVTYVDYANDETNEVIMEKIFPSTIAIRIIRLIPIFGALWYLRSASINKTELWTKFSLQIRLIIMIGGFSTILTITQFISSKFNDVYRGHGLHTIFLALNFIGILMEGTVIGVCFTFRKDTFQPLSTTTRATPCTIHTNTTATSRC